MWIAGPCRDPPGRGGGVAATVEAREMKKLRLTRSARQQGIDMNGMNTRRSARRWPLFLGLAALALTLFVIPVAAASDGQSDVAGARIATASFHDKAAANAAGYTVKV